MPHTGIRVCIGNVNTRKILILLGRLRKLQKGGNNMSSDLKNEVRARQTRENW